MMKPSEYAKATTGAVLAALTSLGTALADGEGVTVLEAVGIAVAAVATFGAVFGVPNTRPRPGTQHRRVHRGEWRSESGQAPFNTFLYLLACAFFALMVVWLFVELIGAVDH